MTNWEKLVSKAEGGIQQLMCVGRPCSTCALYGYCGGSRRPSEVNKWLAEEADETFEEKVGRLEKEVERLQKDNQRLRSIISGNNW